MKRELTVMAIPANENQKQNPYNHILCTGLQAQGVKVKGYSLKTFLRKKEYNLVHLHWPENFLWARSGAGAYKAYLIFWLKLWYLKFRGKKIVWTVHNLKPHEGRFASVSARAYNLLYRRADGFISLTRTGAAEIQKWSHSPEQKIAVIPHPHYSGYYANSTGRREGREKLGIPQNKFVFLFVGQVRAYKNVVGLVNAFKQLPDNDALLVIAGKVHEDVADDLKKAIGREERILLFPRFIGDDDLQLYLNSADLVVTPFTKVLNSGSVFLNLSFARPTLVPATGPLLELRKRVGSQWLKTFEGELSALHLQTSRDEILNQKGGREKPNLDHFDWTKIAQQTKAFYLSLFNQNLYPLPSHEKHTH